MTTAREKLYQEIVALVGAPAGAGVEAEVRKIMGRYRVQTKPGVHIPEGMTARDALGDRLLQLLRENPADVNDKIGAQIDEFRMQVKQRGGASKAAAPAARANNHKPATAKEPLSAPERAPAQARGDGERPAAGNGHAQGHGNGHGAAHEPPGETQPRRMVSEPVAGGPRRRGKTRSECPKCHSMGVVLARSYAGDEYYSCIYCGWQAYKPADENDPAASLAVRLLGQSAPEK